MTAFDYSTGPRVTNVLGHTVYAKSSWAADWTEVPNLTCVECSWTAAPNFNSALLEWETGYVILPGDSSPTVFGTWTGRGQFIKIVWQCDDGGTLVWVGFVDSSSWPTESFGRQQIVCYGLERSLALTPIASSAWYDDSVPLSAQIRRSQVPYDFNVGPDGYRSESAISGSHVFAPLHDPQADVRFWSTRKIVKYLLTHCLPTNQYGVAAIPWQLDQDDQLPDWDFPVVNTRNRTVWDILNELITPQYQLGFTCGSDGSTCYLRAFTHLPTPAVYFSQSIAANPNQHSVVFMPDALTTADLSDVGSTYDQVIIRGDRRKSICTLKYFYELENNWEPSEETAYERAESLHPDYSTWTVEERKARNASKRANEYSRVFRELRLRKTWNYKIFPASLVGPEQTVFPGPPSDNLTPRAIKMLDVLPIKEGTDWKGTVQPTWYRPIDSTHVELARFFPTLTDPTGLQQRLNVLTQLGQLSGKVLSDAHNQATYTIAVSVRERIVSLEVQGAPQHVIADEWFTALPEDEATTGGLDLTTLRITVMLEEDRFVEGVWPASVSADIVRRLVIDLGDKYEQIYIVPGTVTGFDPSGVELTSAGGWLVNDQNEINALAQLIGTGLLPTRKRATWRSQRRISGIAVGDLITTAGGATVNAPISEIKITAPTAEARPASAPTQSFATFGGVFDPLQILRRVGVLST